MCTLHMFNAVLQCHPRPWYVYIVHVQCSTAVPPKALVCIHVHMFNAVLQCHPRPWYVYIAHVQCNTAVPPKALVCVHCTCSMQYCSATQGPGMYTLHMFNAVLQCHPRPWYVYIVHVQCSTAVPPKALVCIHCTCSMQYCSATQGPGMYTLHMFNAILQWQARRWYVYIAHVQCNTAVPPKALVCVCTCSTCSMQYCSGKQGPGMCTCTHDTAVAPKIYISRKRCTLSSSHLLRLTFRYAQSRSGLSPQVFIACRRCVKKEMCEKRWKGWGQS